MGYVFEKRRNGMRFSEKLMELRRREGISQEQLADRLGVTRQSVSKWESGAAMPELAKIIGTLRDPDSIRRWSYLTSFLNTFGWEYEKKKERNKNDNVEFKIG